MTTSELARRAGVKPSTVRYYERTGVLPEPARTAAGYRVYTAEDAERLRYVQRAQALGFTLAEITDLLGLAVSEVDCDAVRARAEAHRADVAAKLRDLERVREALDGLIAACHDRRATAACPILDALRHDDGLMAEPIPTSTVTCPRCGTRTESEMPTDACQFFWACPSCETVLRPREGDCCVFCSYGDVPCPPVQQAEGDSSCSC